MISCLSYIFTVHNWIIMSVLDLARVVVYRFHEKGLEFFLINADLDEDPEAWKIPNGEMQVDMAKFTENGIMLDHTNSDAQSVVRTIAIEGDWHDIPSIRGIIKHDVKRVKRKIKQVVPTSDKGAFVSFKDTVKKVMPEEYAVLKEIKDIIIDRNSIINM